MAVELSLDWYSGSAAKSPSSSKQYGQLRRLRCWPREWKSSIACSILDRNYNSPRTGRSSQTQTKITEHIMIYLRTITIKFFLVIKQRIGDSRYRTQSLRLRRLRFTGRAGTIGQGASFHSSPKINRMLITRLICIQWKSSRFLIPVSTVSARNAWDHVRPFREDTRKKKTSAWKASSTKNKPRLRPGSNAEFHMCRT